MLVYCHFSEPPFSPKSLPRWRASNCATGQHLGRHCISQFGWALHGSEFAASECSRRRFAVAVPWSSFLRLSLFRQPSTLVGLALILDLFAEKQLELLEPDVLHYFQRLSPWPFPCNWARHSQDHVVVEGAFVGDEPRVALDLLRRPIPPSIDDRSTLALHQSGGYIIGKSLRLQELQSQQTGIVILSPRVGPSTKLLTQERAAIVEVVNRVNVIVDLVPGRSS